MVRIVLGIASIRKIQNCEPPVINMVESHIFNVPSFGSSIDDYELVLNSDIVFNPTKEEHIFAVPTFGTPTDSPTINLTAI